MIGVARDEAVSSDKNYYYLYLLDGFVEEQN